MVAPIVVLLSPVSNVLVSTDVAVEVSCAAQAYSGENASLPYTESNPCIKRAWSSACMAQSPPLSTLPSLLVLTVETLFALSTL